MSAKGAASLGSLPASWCRPGFFAPVKNLSKIGGDWVTVATFFLSLLFMKSNATDLTTVTTLLLFQHYQF